MKRGTITYDRMNNLNKKYSIIAIIILLFAISIVLLSSPQNDQTTESQEKTFQPIKAIQKKVKNITKKADTTQDTSKPSTISAPTINPEDIVSIDNDSSIKVAEIIPEEIQNQDKPSAPLSTYTHPSLGYSIEYLARWAAETVTEPYIGFEGYLDARIYPIANQTRISQYQSTPEIIIRVEDTDKDIETYFADDSLGQAQATEIQSIIVDGIPALVYNWSFESAISHTTVMFIDNGKVYKIQFTWSSPEEKNEYLDDFAAIYQSFSK